MGRFPKGEARLTCTSPRIFVPGTSWRRSRITSKAFPSITPWSVTIAPERTLILRSPRRPHSPLANLPSAAFAARAMRKKENNNQKWSHYQPELNPTLSKDRNKIIGAATLHVVRQPGIGRDRRLLWRPIETQKNSPSLGRERVYVAGIENRDAYQPLFFFSFFLDFHMNPISRECEKNPSGPADIR